MLHQLVSINNTALVANAVSFALMDDSDKNLRLCEGFVFNYDSDPRKLKSSTVGVLDALRRSFFSLSEPNIHLMVQDYGKGKSHFALAVANFFKNPYDSLEVQGVLRQVEYATSSTNSTLEGLRLFKQQGRHLVICLSGDKLIDLKKHFLQALKKALEFEGITDTIAQQICQQPLKYIKNLDTKERQKAEDFLERLGNAEGDLNKIEQLLEDDDYRIIPRVKEICRELTGITPDFEADIDVEAILADLINRLCKGNNPRFQGILILFDELYNYLQIWANNPVQAGSTTLQNITNVCETYKRQIALISFTQRRPKSVTPLKNTEDYNRLVSRLELLPSTYEPAASLELVLDGLLNQQDQSSAWQEFLSKWRDTLTAINTDIYQNRTVNYYQVRNWTPQKFLKHITMGCFPLHPLTSYLLCNLDFTQGRTAIQFVQEDIKNFILEEPIEKNGSPNFIYPVALIDAFEGNFATSDYSSYSGYKRAYDSIVASAAPEELTILNALFLFYASASASKLTKSDREKHEVILSLLTGISEPIVKAILSKLCQLREVIYHNPADNTYRFYSGGFGIQDLRKRIEEEVANKPPSMEHVREYCQSNLRQYVGGDTISPTQFIEENRLVSSDWLFKCEVYTAAKFREALKSHRVLENDLGIVTFVIAATSEDLARLRSEIEQLLAPSPHDPTSIKRRIAVVIASQPVAEIARLLLMLETAKRKSIQEFGAALTQLQQQLQQQIDKNTAELFKSCIYHCHILDKIPVADRSNPSRVTSAIFKDLYPLVPSVEKIDKMALKSLKGGEVIGYASKRLLENDLRPHAFPQQAYANVIDPVFVRSWRMLREDAQSQKYLIQVPVQRTIRAAWDKISEMTHLGERSEKIVEIAEIWRTLSAPPYGYNEYTFTILFAGWLAHYRAEVLLKGGFGIPQRKSDQVSVRTEPIKNWTATNVFDKPKDFIHDWVLRGKQQLIRRKPLSCPEVPDAVDYDRAQQFIQEIDDFLSSASEPAKVDDLVKTRQQLTIGIERIDEQLKPIARAENLLETDNLPGLTEIESLVQLCSDLQQSLSAIFEGSPSVSPTQQQQHHHHQVLQAVIERIGQAVEAEGKRSQSLRTEADCSAYKAEIQQLMTQIRQVANLPYRFTETLQAALRTADNKLVELAEQKKVDDCLSQIQNLYNRLSDLATQQEYVRTQVEIEKIVEAIPLVLETDTYRNVIQALKEKQEALVQQIAHWESQFSTAISRNQSIELIGIINQQLNRFTDENCRQKLQALLKHLKSIVLERESEAREEDQLQTILTTAEQKLQAVETLKNLSDAFQAYQDLLQITLPAQPKSIFLEENRKQIEVVKSKGYAVISTKLAQVVEGCNRKLNYSGDYDQLKSLVQTSQSLIAVQEEFAVARTNLKEAEQKLENQYAELQDQQYDADIIESIRQHSLTKINTMYVAEESITAIEKLHEQLRHPEKFASEVNKLLKSLRDKIASHQKNLQNLCDRLSTVETYKQLTSIRDESVKLELVFKDSKDYTNYQRFQDTIRLLAEDLDRVRKLENFKQQSYSIASCNEALKLIANEQVNLHDLNRFQPKLLQLQDHLLQRKQGYVQQLTERQNNLSSVKTLKDAQRLQKELAEKSACYRKSQEEARYEAISSEVNQLIYLLQISESQNVDTTQACQAERSRLLQWRGQTEGITPTVQTLLESILTKLEQTEQQIRAQQRSAANSWLENIENNDMHLAQLTEPSLKLGAATQLLKQIRKQKQQHEEMLEAAQKQTLERISKRCVEIQNQDKESQIFVLFQELPRNQRENLLSRLAEYLSNITEEFNDG